MEINKMDGMSMDIEQTEMEKLKSVFPQCFAEGKLDIDKLLSLCGEYIDNDFEKYKFEWKGKIEALKLAQKRSTGTLRPCKAESVNFDETKNLYIEGDNLEVLKLLQTAYYNKIKMIYIDPPYNTGNDFVYEDDFADPMARYKEVTQQTTKSNAETMGRYHTNWLNMMYPRLRLAHNLLRQDGVIFISIDDNEVTNLRKLCDEVFGEENRVAEIPWQSRASVQNDTDFSVNHEYVLIYAKNRRQENRRLKETNYEEWHKKDSFVCKPLPLEADKFSNPDNDPRGAWKADPFDAPNIRANLTYEITNPNTGEKHLPPNGRHWRMSEDKFLAALNDNRIVWTNNGNGRPQLKVFYEEKKEFGSVDNSWFSADRIGTSTNGTKELLKIFDGKSYFDTPKPTSLLRKLITLANVENDDIVLDFFSGSSTTAHAVLQSNSEDGNNIKFIMVQLPEMCGETTEARNDGFDTICEIGKERIRRVGKKILEENTQIELGDEEKTPLDVGFKVFKLDTSNLKTWDGTPIQDKQIDLFYERLNAMIDTVKDDRTDMDVVYEVMLKMGIPLDVEVQYMEINDKIAYIVGDFILMICLADKITAEDIEAMAQYAPAKIICAEAGFADDSALSNAHYILKDRAIELKLV
ncbi:MAG: site-specific DNA-methyltransferase [Lachnospiraceae bacterium]|nr:site-specific DNA-methyltransferase [Lachnospiraceae bacterium]